MIEASAAATRPLMEAGEQVMNAQQGDFVTGNKGEFQIDVGAHQYVVTNLDGTKKYKNELAALKEIYRKRVAQQ